MEIYPEPRVTDEDVETLIEWLGTKKTINQAAISMVVTTLKKLMKDRNNLTRRLLGDSDV